MLCLRMSAHRQFSLGCHWLLIRCLSDSESLVSCTLHSALICLGASIVRHKVGGPLCRHAELWGEARRAGTA